MSNTPAPPEVEEIDSTLQFALELIQENPTYENTIALEFGVATGRTMHMISKVLPVTGFDSFKGLPEKWRAGFGRGMFAQRPPRKQRNETLRIGLFTDTTKGWSPDKTISLIHIDCDLYSSTQTVLWSLLRWMREGKVHKNCLIVFDEFHGYPGYEGHEMLAWSEFLTISGVEIEHLLNGPEQACFMLIGGIQ